MSREGGRFFEVVFLEKYSPTLISGGAKIMTVGLYETVFFIKPLITGFPIELVLYSKAGFISCYQRQ